VSDFEQTIGEARGRYDALGVGELWGGLLPEVPEHPAIYKYFVMVPRYAPVEPDEIFASLEEEPRRRTGVYLDVPFCARACDFCIFHPLVPEGRSQMRRYVDLVGEEMRMLARSYFDGSAAEVHAVAVGGGTPTFLPPEELGDLLDRLLGTFRFAPDFLFTVEASPDTLVGDRGQARLELLAERGVNRLSVGVQSWEEGPLAATNRPHNAEQVALALDNVRRVGFERVCLDLMLGLPEQTLEGFLDSVRRAIDWGADIISVYPMRFYGRPRWLGNKPDERRSLLDLPTQLVGRIAADSLLRAAGYESFEATYWHRSSEGHAYHSEYIEGSMKGGNWLGVGHKAQSNLYPHQYSNFAHLGRYADAIEAGRLPIAEGARFTPRQRLGKQLVSMLQLPTGIDWAAVDASFDVDTVAPFAELTARFESAGLLAREGQATRWTERGFFFIDEMMKAVYELALGG